MSTFSNKEQAFLNRLTKITEDNLSNSQFGVSELAREFGKSRSYIHRRLKLLTNESLSQFIRRIRLEKAFEMLGKNELTVAEVAYDTGFGSPSYFTKCFHDKFGYAPGEYQRYATEDNETNRTIISDANHSSSKSIKRNSILKKLLIPLWVIAVLLVSGLYVYQSLIKPEPEKSIAILTLKNLSNDVEIQHLADGIMEDIRTRLSHINGLEVKSQVSSDKYSDTKLSASEIAKELGVSYILEGSIIPDREKIGINVQLISAIKDDHVWAESLSFDKDLTGILEFIADISKQVTEKLKVVLSTEEISQVEKIYTANTEAYSLYQKGRFFWHRRTEESLNQSVKYFNQALELDSTYALAHAGLADVFFIQAWWGWSHRADGYAKSKTSALKALEFDNNLAEAHATLGGIACWYDYNWKFAKKSLSRAIELNPNNAEVYQYFSEYYDIIGDQTRTRFCMNKAIELNPYSKIKYYESGLYYYNEGKWDEALKEGVKVVELDENFKKQYFINFTIFLHKNDDKQAIDNLLIYLNISFPGENYSELVNTVYTKSEIDGVIRWSIGKLLQDPNVDVFNIAKLYGILQDARLTLEYLNKAFVSSSQIPRMKNYYDFKFISDDSEFEILLKKLNLPVD